jgi:phage FluMu protein Com
MAGPDTCCDLARCDHCQEIVSIRSSSVRPPCPKCRRQVQVITIELSTRIDPEPIAGPLNLECPRCRSSTMVLTEVGLWD